jgi:steroid delta-isomerase-like uncharacterized protein
MPADDNKAIARHLLAEMFTAGNLSLIDERYAAGFILHNPAYPAEVRGPEGMKRLVASFRTAFPDLDLRIEDQIAEGSLVVTRWTAQGTHLGDLMGVAPTGRPATFTGIDIQRFANGQVMEAWSEMDTLSLLRQIGAIPTAG